MRKVFLTYCDYPSGNRTRNTYEAYTKPRFIEYCNRHGFEFVEIANNIAAPYNLGFAKVFWIKQNMANLNDGDIVTYMDVDCCIMDGTIPAIFDKDFAIVQESTGCLCMGGTWSIRISEWSRRFIEAMCSDELQAKNKDLQSWHTWHENDAVYHILGLNWGQPMSEIGTRDTTPFSQEELKEHVQILGSEWGCTFNSKDTLLDDNCFESYKMIAKYHNPSLAVSFENIKVRHLSAGTLYEPWAFKYFNTPMK